MTPRKRIEAVINFEKPDVLPWCEAFHDETLVKWFGEGLSADEVTVVDWEVREGGVSLLNWPIVKGFNPYSYFGCYSRSGLSVPLDLGPIPRYRQRAIAETERYADILTQTGAVARRFKQAEYVWYNIPMFLSFPVKDRESWEEYEKRLDPYDPRRCPKDWEKDAYVETFENYQEGSTILYLTDSTASELN